MYDLDEKCMLLLWIMQILYVKSAEQHLEDLMLMMKSKYFVKWEIDAFNELKIPTEPRKLRDRL